jgi:NAD/NADP transhydrogenase beta subunit
MHTKPDDRTGKRKKDFIWVERVSYLLDNKFNIGGFRFGLDPLLNLIPYAGQIISFGISILLVLIMLRNGAGSKVAVKMLLNVIYDAFFGAIPFFGQVFDFFHKANQKNIILLHEYYFEEKHQGSAKKLLISIFIILLVVCIALFYFIWLLSGWFIRLLGTIF